MSDALDPADPEPADPDRADPGSADPDPAELDRAGLDPAPVLDAVGVALGRPLTLLEPLGGSPRSGVWRAGDDAGTVVLKAHRDGAAAARREAQGLSGARGSGVAPRLLLVLDEPAVVVMEDLGTGPDVADGLLSRDPARARRSMRLWAEAVAGLHVASHPRAAELRGGTLGSSMPALVTQAAEDLDRHADRLGVGHVDGFAEALTGLAAGLAGSEHQALSPGDVCPDNNTERDGRLVLFDFEFAELRDVAWDASYLRVPWPTCWCAWQVPEAETRAALDRYREVAAATLPHVGTDAFEAEVDAAVLAWCLLTTSWFLPAALDDDPVRSRHAPRRRPVVLHRLELVARSEGPDPLRDLAGRLRRALVDRWGEQPLALAPAFR